MAKEGEIDWMDSFCTISAEALFILVPFVVIGTVSFYKGEAHSIIYKPDWALAASIFLGQVLVKMVSGLLTAASTIETGERDWGVISIIFASIIVLLLVPSLLVLTLVLVAPQPSKGLAIAQVVLFSFGLTIFILFGTLSHGVEISALVRGSRRLAIPKLESDVPKPPVEAGHRPAT